MPYLSVARSTDKHPSGIAADQGISHQAFIQAVLLMSVFEQRLSF